MTFMREKITYTLDNSVKSDGGYLINDKWIITTDTNLEVLCTTKSIYMNNFQVFEEELVKTNNPFSCVLKLEWRGGEEETKRLRQKIILEGSKGRKHLVLFWPPMPGETCMSLYSMAKCIYLFNLVPSRSFDSATSLPSPSASSLAMPSPPATPPSRPLPLISSMSSQPPTLESQPSQSSLGTMSCDHCMLVTLNNTALSS